jgi:hypothetical protein
MICIAVFPRSSAEGRFGQFVSRFGGLNPTRVVVGNGLFSGNQDVSGIPIGVLEASSRSHAPNA